MLFEFDKFTSVSVSQKPARVEMGYALSVRDTMMIAHSFKGPEFGPAQGVCQYWGVVYFSSEFCVSDVV